VYVRFCKCFVSLKCLDCVFPSHCAPIFLIKKMGKKQSPFTWNHGSLSKKDTFHRI